VLRSWILLFGLVPMLQAPLFRLAFRLRHRNLRRLFGQLAPRAGAEPLRAP
jgi:hypothetical protein